ncbi:hypothetical protein AWB78_01363 [Caballeronia calidae]|uniref:Uncharacterized protein n=1 Tax=Caballeronia calidae TaxID=1777139 RepID=A0A158A7J5_9BURK|nr:hypothetical protein [Caballeronia calidae]SAK53812.1 hypothetical protein AWB78_01363 [Caballeronia calidae]
MNELPGLDISVRLRLRFYLGDAIREVVLSGSRFDEAVKHVVVPDGDAAVFKRLLRSELQTLHVYNCARFRLPMDKVQAWIEKGRPQ